MEWAKNLIENCSTRDHLKAESRKACDLLKRELEKYKYDSQRLTEDAARFMEEALAILGQVTRKMAIYGNPEFQEAERIYQYYSNRLDGLYGFTIDSMDILKDWLLSLKEDRESLQKMRASYQNTGDEKTFRDLYKTARQILRLVVSQNPANMSVLELDNIMRRLFDAYKRIMKDGNYWDLPNLKEQYEELLQDVTLILQKKLEDGTIVGQGVNIAKTLQDVPIALPRLTVFRSVGG